MLRAAMGASASPVSKRIGAKAVARPSTSHMPQVGCASRPAPCLPVASESSWQSTLITMAGNAAAIALTSPPAIHSGASAAMRTNAETSPAVAMEMVRSAPPSLPRSTRGACVKRIAHRAAPMVASAPMAKRMSVPYGTASAASGVDRCKSVAAPMNHAGMITAINPRKSDAVHTP